MHKPSGRDDLIHAALVEGLADDVAPSGQLYSKLLIGAPSRNQLLGHDLLLDGHRGIFLLQGDREPLKESLVQDVRPDEASVLGALALGVGRSQNRESRSRRDDLIDLLEENRLSLKDRLEAHDPIRGQIDLIQEQNRSPAHGFDHGAVKPDSLTIVESEATQKVVLIRFDGDIHAEQLPLGLGTSLLDHHGLAVAGKPCDKGRIEHPTGQDRSHVLEMSEGDIIAELLGNSRVGQA